MTVLEEPLERINQLLTTAESQGDGTDDGNTRQALVDAARTCAAANEMADQFAQIEGMLDALESQVAALRAKYAEPPLVPLKLANFERFLQYAQTDAEEGKFRSAMNLAQKIASDLAELDSIGARHAVYVAQRKTIDPRVEILVKSKARYAVARELDTIRESVTRAETMADQHNYEAAMKILAQAADLCDAATVQADMHEEKAPTREALQKILAKPGATLNLTPSSLRSTRRPNASLASWPSSCASSWS